MEENVVGGGSKETGSYLYSIRPELQNDLDLLLA
jgi:hypothetical protein